MLKTPTNILNDATLYICILARSTIAIYDNKIVVNYLNSNNFFFYLNFFY